jgi:hypothetical protein
VLVLILTLDTVAIQKLNSEVESTRTFLLLTVECSCRRAEQGGKVQHMPYTNVFLIIYENMLLFTKISDSD